MILLLHILNRLQECIMYHSFANLSTFYFKYDMKGHVCVSVLGGAHVPRM
jgi:hypothetical protein